MNKEEKTNVEKAILDAANEEFLNKGFSGARTVTIAEKAGVTHAMLHYYFRSKENLFERVIETETKTLIDSITEAFKSQEASLSFEDRVVAVMNAHLDFIIANPKLPAFLFTEVFPSKDHFETVKEKGAASLGTLLSEIKEILENASEEIDNITLPMLISDVITLNAATVVSAQLASRILGISQEEYVSLRKRENEILIRKRLKK